MSMITHHLAPDLAAQLGSLALSALMAVAAGLIGSFAVMRRMLLGAVLIWAVERRMRIATEAVIGVTFAVALAVGSIITSGEELIDALLGAPGTLTPWEVVFGVVGSLIVIVFVLRERNALVVRLISPEI